MFPRAVLNPTRHMEKFMDMANVDNYLHDKHLYAITERGKKNLPENDASHGMRLLGGGTGAIPRHYGQWDYCDYGPRCLR